MSEFEIQFGEFLSDEPNFDAALSHLKRSISAICRSDRGIAAYYIGKASGVEPIGAIYRRYNGKKTSNMFTEDWALYESHCDNTVGMLEDALISYYMRIDPRRCTNEGTGSAGRPSDQPRHYIYLVTRRT